MESWPKRKRVRTQQQQKPASQNHDDLLLATAHLVSEVAGGQRTDRACLQRVALLPCEHPVSIALLKAGQDYSKNKKEANDQDVSVQEPDYPFVYVWQSLILALQQCDILSSEEKLQLTTHSTAMQTPELVLEHVRVCKAKLTHKSDAVKLVAAVDYTLRPLVYMIFQALKRIGTVVKYGPAPPSSNERAVRDLLRQYK
jgi:hypothetical protein